MRGLPRRPALDARQPHRTTPDLRELAEHYSRLIEDRQARPRRPRSRLPVLVHVAALVRGHRRPGARRRRSCRPASTMALRFNDKGRYLRSFLAADSLFVDIMMNVGVIFHAAQRDRRHRARADRRRPLPDVAAAPRTRRRQRLPRGHLRPGHRRVPASRRPSRDTRDRRLVGARAGLGAVRLRHRLPLHRRPPLPRHRAGVRRLLHRADRRRARVARTTGRSRTRPVPTRAPPPPSPPAGCGSSPG